MTALRAVLRSAVLTAGAALGVVCALWTLTMLATGATPLVVLSGSMSPALRAGDVAFAVTVPAEDIAIGDIVTVTSGTGIRITHRVVDAETDAGTSTLRLKGDANSAADDETYTASSALKVVWHLPGIGWILHAAASPVGVAGGLALLAGCLILGRSALRTPRVRSDADDAARSAADRRRRRPRRFGVLLLVALVTVGSASAPRTTVAYYTDIPTVRSPADAYDASPWFTCHEAMTSAPLAPLFYYRFNDPAGSTTAADSSGNNRTATMAGTTGTTYKFDQAQPCGRDTDTAAAFTGAGAWAMTPEVLAVGGPNGASWNTFTVSMWFRGDTAPATGPIGLLMMNQWPNGGGSHDRLIYVDATGRLRFGVYNGNGVNTLVTPAAGAPGYVDFRLPRWHMVTVSLSSAGMKMYVDGAWISATTTEQGRVAATVTTAAQYASAYWFIGATIAPGWPGGLGGNGAYWKGSISKAGIWTRALTDQQILDLYRSGLPLRN
ncbi:signal peptidase I [Microbacterium sp. A8/3-1]|uniref:Signal peptidase I n=1 Tax=Microbacterium sp. A8/3-1 TaxID=3160749 RepID=A0AAU7VT65_9MICO